MVLYSEFTYGYQFSEETNGLEIRFLIPEILNKYKRSIIFETPCKIYQGVMVGGRRPSVEDDLWWKTAFLGIRPSVEDDLIKKDNPCMLLSPLCCFAAFLYSCCNVLKKTLRTKI